MEYEFKKDEYTTSIPSIKGDKAKVYFFTAPITPLETFVKPGFKANEKDVLVTIEFFYGASISDELRETGIHLGFNLDNVYPMSNTEDYLEFEEEINGIPRGNFRYINHNSFFDEEVWFPFETKKVYDFIMNVRPHRIKRVHLAEKVDNIYLLYADKNETGLPQIFEKYVNTKEVIETLNKSKVGVILSEREGACYASGEYLMCGLPVVSTKSLGGRDYQYTDYNSIICEDDPDAVKEACDEMLLKVNTGKIDNKRIHNENLEIIKPHRERFVELLREVFEKVGIIDPKDNIKRQMLKLSYFSRRGQGKGTLLVP